MLDAKHQKQMQHILELLISNGKISAEGAT